MFLQRIKKYTGPLVSFVIMLFIACLLVIPADTETASQAVPAAESQTVPAETKVTHRTVYSGIDYAPVYDYDYYVERHPSLLSKYGANDKKILRHYVLKGYPKKEKASESATSAAFAKVQKARIAKYLKNTATAQKTSQIIVVCDHELSLWNKQEDGSWKRSLKYYCGYGKNGLALTRHAGDKTTPIGSFPILLAFGKAANPGTEMTWKDITPYSYWSAEYDTYNTWVESRSSMAGEHLTDYYQYAYAMAIGFNINPTVFGRGSAIFLHCKSTDRWWTAGCVSVRTKVMKKLLRRCKDGTYIIIVPKDTDIKKY